MRRKILTGLVVAQSFVACVLSTGVAYATATNTPTTAVTVLDSGGDPINTLVKWIQTFGGWLLLIAGAIAIVFLVIGGVRYIVSAGNPEQTKGAKQTIIYALIGLGVIITALILASLVGALFK